jgi:hypothetical protein
VPNYRQYINLEGGTVNGLVWFVPHQPKDCCISHYRVGADGDLFKKLLGGAIGLGLKQIIRECYDFVVTDYSVGDEIYLIGFSRGAYAARALAGLIGASGVQRSTDTAMFETAWRHYRVKPAVRGRPETASSSERAAIDDYAAAGSSFYDTRTVKCVAVWDTVGSYGIPAGLGLAPLARYFALLTLGFHDTSFGDHVEVGLHAVAVDEHRRPFVPTKETDLCAVRRARAA